MSVRRRMAELEAAEAAGRPELVADLCSEVAT
jgi:hypothetical protein